MSGAGPTRLQAEALRLRRTGRGYGTIARALHISRESARDLVERAERAEWRAQFEALLAAEHRERQP